ncbi:DinB family protein [Alteromonas facilis]|uniref:DinB family protein n=1 Tax=Alteromonas facilis TaxID=2048004 RepID=UPI000C284D89|nr:DinB family protein [Alteromonas facilis]
MLQSQVEVVSQALEVLNELSSEEYQQVLTPHFSGSIGQHIRHIIDHYLALQTGSLSGVVDYNQRNRDSNIELSVAVAIEALQAIQRWLQTLSADVLAQSVTVSSEISVTQQVNQRCVSTLAREVMFVSSHAIHHYSLIAIIRSLQGKSVPDLFGYAPATVSYMSANGE